jgi:hypothetical protein
LSPSNSDATKNPNPELPVRGLDLSLKIGGAVLIFALATLSAARLASASFGHAGEGSGDETGALLGSVAASDGIVTGTVRITGGHFAFYSGDRFESTTGNLAVNFSAGGSLILCPHSQVQILADNRNSAIMVAFQQGGSQQPFPVHTHDVVMTPDWQIEMSGDVHEGDTGVLQLSTNRHGALCVSGNVQSGAFFHVSELAGDKSFDVPGQTDARFSDGKMEDVTGGCACDAGSPRTGPNRPAKTLQEAGMIPNGGIFQDAGNASAGPDDLDAANIAPERKARKHSQDVVGYVGSFIHMMFGR